MKLSETDKIKLAVAQELADLEYELHELDSSGQGRLSRYTELAIRHEETFRRFLEAFPPTPKTVNNEDGA